MDFEDFFSYIDVEWLLMVFLMTVYIDVEWLLMGFLMTVILNSIFAFADENTNLLIFVITAGSGSGDSQHKKIKNLQKDLDYLREKVMELEKELKMVC